MSNPAKDRFIERAIAADPNYGSQEHQRHYLACLDDLQRLQPCTRNHPLDEQIKVGDETIATHGEHVMTGNEQCYSADVKAVVFRDRITP